MLEGAGLGSNSIPVARLCAATRKHVFSTCCVLGMALGAVSALAGSELPLWFLDVSLTTPAEPSTQ